MVSVAKSVSGKRSCRRLHSLVFPLILAGLLLPAAAFGQISYTGLSATQNFGSQAIGSPSAARTFNFSVTAGITVGSIAVVTQGAPNLDFTNATGGTCAAQTYSSATTCAVNVTFTPKAAGLRMGAVVFFSAPGNTGTILGNVAIYGIGIGPQAAYTPGTPIIVDPLVDGLGLLYPNGMAMDGAGDLFIADGDNSRVVEVLANGGGDIAINPMVNGESLNEPEGVAVDGAGDLFITDNVNYRVVEVPAGGSAATAFDPMVNGKGLYVPVGIAVDGAGDLFIADSWNNRVVEVPAGGGAPIAIDPTVNGGGLSFPANVSVDGAGDLFIADPELGLVVKVPAGGGAAIAIDPSVNGESLDAPAGTAVDGAGDLLISDADHNRVVEVPADGGPATAIDPDGLFSPGNLVLDSAGDLFILDGDNSRVVELQRSHPVVNFPTATDVGTTDTTDGTQSMQLQNIGSGALMLTAIGYPADFPQVSGGASPCTDSTSLNAGQTCDVLFDFAPQKSGLLNESIMVTDNTLNGIGAVQPIGLTGTAKGADHFSVTTTASVAAGAPFNVTVTALTSSNETFTTYNGTVTFTSSDPFFVNPGPLALSNGTGQTVLTFKTTGAQTLTATDTETPALKGTGSFQVAPGAATLTSPTPGGVLAGPSATFSWTAGYEATNYSLFLGFNGAGSGDLYSSGVTTATSATVTGLQTKGATIYARLLSEIGGAWYHNDYIYTEATSAAATISSPAPGANLGASGVMFSWTPGAFVTSYDLLLGTNAPGSGNLYNSGVISVTSATAPSLPADGAKVYARLFSEGSGGIQYVDYTYTEATGTSATLTAPMPGTTLGTSNVVFRWNAGTDVTKYDLLVGFGGPGSADLYATGSTTALTATVPTLPANGAKIYVRLMSDISGTWHTTDYTFTAQ